MPNKSKSGITFTKNAFIKFSVFLFAFFITLVLTQEFVFSVSAFKNLELNLIDKRFENRGTKDIADSSDVIILELNQKSHDQVPAPFKFPYPRFFYAKVIENLVDAGARVIGIDVVFSDKDSYDAEYDSVLFACIQKYRNVVVAGKFDVESEFVSDARKKGELMYSTAQVKRTNFNFENIFYPADSSVGIVQMIKDNDDVFRRYYPFYYSNVYDKLVPTFSFAVLNKYFNLESSYVAKNGDGYFDYNDILIPKFDPSSMLINFYGIDRTFPRVRFMDVLDDSGFQTIDEIEMGVDINSWDMTDPDLKELFVTKFKDKIVLIGSTEPEDKDLFPTSISKGEYEGDNIMYGVEIHANVIQDILDKNFLSKQSVSSEILMLFLILLLSYYGSSFVKQIKTKNHLLVEVGNLLLVILIAFGFYWAGFYMFNNFGIIIAMVSPILGVSIGYFASTAYHLISERLQNKMIKGMFSTYVSSDLVNILLKEPDKLKLGGEKRNLSILFSDIAGFTSFSERLSPEKLVEFINQYLTEMTDVVLSNRGTLDKYIGDAVMAFWGAPIELQDHEALACKTALQMQKRLRELQASWGSEQGSFINIRIGINSGDVVVGNIGGRNRFDYTVMGDNVNLASRLEGANKQYGTDIMIGENTYKKISDQFIFRELDNIIVKGKVKPTKVYELIGEPGDKIAEAKLESLKHYFEGLRYYKQKKFETALVCFEKSYKETIDKSVSYVYLERCKYYIENPPDENWDGAFQMKTK